MRQLEKKYMPKQIEDRIYKSWEENELFKAFVDKNKKPYTIVIPPPNVTGQLHMGHALDETLQDILIRFKRMKGFSALWVPGTDHAGIATQIKVEEDLKQKEGKTRHDLGRDEFLKRVWEWKELYGNRIITQLKKLGSSCDWSRERFTMDEGCSKAVREVFVNLYDKGLIYRGNRIINWCPRCVTALSDAEVEHEEKDGNFWYIKYPVKGLDEFVIIATTRPETMLGDTAVAVNPEDGRYKHLIGKTLILPLTGREIPVIADEYVDKDFGTGAVKITPAHDPNDFEVGLRHNLVQIKIMNDDATINEKGGRYKNLDRYEARKQIIADLKEEGLLDKIEPHKHNVGGCYRCGSTVEPITSDQWFVKMEELSKPAIEAVKNQSIKFVPERFSRIYLNWMENVYDWCISRQLWWGHRIPAFYCDECNHMTVSKTDIEICPKCGSGVRQDEDVLDTWFSSALWPFSTLGFPKETPELEYFYPTSVLVTSYDIIFFWVARMIFSGLEHTKKAPFEHVFIHGLVRDNQGQKMSKSAGNGVDPLEIIDRYGADALRFSLVTGNSPGNDMRFYEERVETGGNFANKLWNASKFVLMHINDEEDTFENLRPEDKWIMSRLNKVIKEVTENIENFELGIALQKIYEFVWEEFCDWYIELVKPRLYDKTLQNKNTVLKTVLKNILKLLHPFMPFITEEIWQCMENTSIMVSEFSSYNADFVFEKEEAEFGIIKDAIKSIRNLRSEKNIPPSRKFSIYIKTDKKELFEESKPFLEKLAGCSSIEMTDCEISEAVCLATETAKIFIKNIIDKDKERERLLKEKQNIIKEIERADSKLNNQGFISKAPPKLIEEEKQKKLKYIKIYDKIIESLESLN